MRKIKILYFMDGIGNAGGIQEMIINWVKNFDLTKFQIDILSYDTGKKDNYSERFEKFGGKVYIIPTFTKKGQLFKSLKKTKDFFDKHNDYQILHAHASSKAFFIINEARKHNIKIRILHSHATKFVNRNFKSLFIGNILKPLTNLVATHYFACSHEAGNFLFGKKRMDSIGVFIPNGVDLNNFYYDENIALDKKKELKIPKEKIIIGNVGRFRPQKNHAFLIDVFYEITKINDNVVLILVGNGELLDAVIKKAKDLNIDDKVLFLGYRNDVNEIVQTFDVLVMPSLFEGLPVTCIEAQAVGIPCVLSSEITKDAKIIPNVEYLQLNDKKEKWVNTILKLSSKGKCLNSKKYLIEKNFDIKESAKLLESLYTKYISK